MDEGIDRVCVERWLSNKQLIQDDPQRPQIHLYQHALSQRRYTAAVLYASGAQEAVELS